MKNTEEREAVRAKIKGVGVIGACELKKSFREAENQWLVCIPWCIGKEKLVCIHGTVCVSCIVNANSKAGNVLC